MVIQLIVEKSICYHHPLSVAELDQQFPIGTGIQLFIRIPKDILANIGFFARHPSMQITVQVSKQELPLVC